MKLHRLVSCLFALLPLSLWAQEPTSAPTSASTSSPTSIAAVCGNGAKDPGEACDDGNTNDADGCSARCTIVAGKEKSPLTALGIALGASAAGVGFIAAAASVENENLSVALAMTGFVTLVVAPSAGHLYSGEIRHALIFSGARVGAVGLFGFGFLTLVGNALEGSDASGLGALGVIVGSLGTAGLTLYDLVDAPRSAKRAQTQASLLPKKALPSLLPKAVALPDGGLAPALTLGLRF